MDYKTSGVDISKGEDLVSRIKSMMGSAGGSIGHFGGAVPIPVGQYSKPLLISSIDGVGTKIMVAKIMNQYDTIGQDLVHHCMNDIACCGAESIAFMDYIAMAEMNLDVATDILKGMITACQRWNIALIGGENAEMPGVYMPGEFDLAGVIYGIMDEADFIDGKEIRSGDLMIGFPSNGLHTNGYSLARKVVEQAGGVYNQILPGTSRSIGDALLAVHTCYQREIRLLKSAGAIKGLAHITGGGLEGNTRRIIPGELVPVFDWKSWEPLPVFNWLRDTGEIPESEMRRVFNLGIGLIAVIAPENLSVLKEFTDPEVLQPKVVGEIANKTLNKFKNTVFELA